MTRARTRRLCGRCGPPAVALCAVGLVALLGMLSCGRQPSDDVAPASRGPQVRVVQRLGEIIKPSPGESDSWGIGMGAALREGETVYLVYSGSQRRNDEGSVRWLPHVAVSRDGGSTWRKTGKVMDMPEGRIMVTPESLVRHKGHYYLFYHTQREGAAFRDAEGWAIGAARSVDMTQWEDLGEFMSSADYGLDGALTNPSVLQANGTWHMAASCLLGTHKYGIRLFRSAELLGPYEDLGVVIDPDNAQRAWYSHGAWDAEMFRHAGLFYILFGGRSGVQRGSFRHYGLAVSEHPEGPWRVAAEPFFTNPDGQVGGRSAVFPNADGTVTAVVDLWLGGERNSVRGFRLELRDPELTPTSALPGHDGTFG